MIATVEPHDGARSEERLRVFLSYSRADSALADQLCDALRLNGFDVLIDRQSLPFGELWKNEIAELIRASHVAVWLVSSHSTASEWCLWEIAQLAELRRRVVPLRISPQSTPGLPEAIHDIQMLPAEGVFSIAEHLGVLCATLETDHQWVKEGLRIFARAWRWQSRHRSRDELLRGQALDDAEEWLRKQPARASSPSQLQRDYVYQSRGASVRRRTLLMVVSLLVAVAAIGLAMLAWNNERRAMRNNRAAHAAVDTIVRGIGESLNNAIGVSHAALQKLLLQSETALRVMSDDGSPDPETALMKAALFAQIAQSFLDGGNTLKARSAAETGFAILKSTPYRASNQEARSDLLCRLHHVIGDIGRVTAELDKAIDNYREALKLRRSAAEGSNDPIKWRSFAQSLDRVGDVQRTAGRFDEAMRTYEEAEVVKLRFLDAEPDSEIWLNELSWTHNRIGDTLRRNQDHHAWVRAIAAGISERPDGPSAAWREALARYRRALAIRQRLADRSPTRIDVIRNLAWSKNLVGVALLALSEPDAALAHHESALSDLRQLERSTEGRSEVVRDLALTYGYLGDHYLTTGRRELGMASYEKSIELRKRLEAIDPQNLRWARDLFHIRVRIADLATLMGLHATASEHSSNARSAAGRLAEAFPADTALAEAIRSLN